jgi:hypothetical protein
MEDIMLQRFDISMDIEANRLSIKEFAVLGRITRKRGNFETANKKYSFMHKVTYDGDIIRAAINEGKGALVSALRTDDFFPIHSCAEVIVESVIELFEKDSDSFSEVFFDDQDIFPKDDE